MLKIVSEIMDRIENERLNLAYNCNYMLVDRYNIPLCNVIAIIMLFFF